MINFKKFRYWQYQYELYQEKGLTDSASKLYSYLFTHCIYHHREGWCGLSNENLTEKIGFSLRTTKNALKELREKQMIVIKNPGKRTKQIGKSREIHINAKNYLVEESEEVNTDNKSLKLIEQLKKDNEELQKEVNRLRLEQAQVTYINELGHSLIKTGFITESRYQEQSQELNHILLDFESWHREGRDLTKACFNYWNAHKGTEVRNYVKYILTCIDTSNELDKQKRQDCRRIRRGT